MILPCMPGLLSSLWIATIAFALDPAGEPVRVPVSRDTWVSSVASETEANLGGAPRLKLKSYQEFSLIDIDPAALRGRVITSATLHLRSAGEPSLKRVTVGTVGVEWTEGTSGTYAPEPGGSSFAWRRNPGIPWTTAGGDICHVILGRGGTLWKSADAFPPDDKGWQRVAVEPAVVAARVAGIGHGFVLFDDTGSEWTRREEQVDFHLFPNRFVFSRESGADSAPYLTVHLGDVDHEAPGAPEALQRETDALPPGEAVVSWITPKDHGPAGTIGFFAKVQGRDVPRDLIPTATTPGERVRMHLRDLDLPPGTEVPLEVRAVDAAGNVGPAMVGRIAVSAREPLDLPAAIERPRTQPAALPRVGSIAVAVIDELDKVHPVSGAMIPPQAEGYWASNHLWDAGGRTIRLTAGRNEFLGFQVVLQGNPAVPVVPALSFEGQADAADAIRVELGRYELIPTSVGFLPDPILPLGLPARPSPPGRSSRSMHVELYVPHKVQPGMHRGRLTLQAQGRQLVLPIELSVRDFTLPDHLSFLPEMNCYGLPPNERDYYRLAHAHRTVLNRVPYSQNGTVAEGCAPAWNGKTLDWSAWDRRFGPYLDGSAFADLPRAGVPIECFYLPLHENWPEPMQGNYNGSYWADQAFPPSYRASFVEVARQFATHFDQRGWHETLFEGFLNNKNNFKERGWSRGSSPWLLDEPAHFQDFWALRWFGEAFHEGVQQAGGEARMVYRADISRPEWQRDVLDGLLDVHVVGGAFRTYRRMVLDDKRAHGTIVQEYGSANALTEPNTQAVAWCLDAWSLGADGVVPWQTIGRGDSWNEADSLALFYPDRDRADAPPIPSIRLKAFRRGQQDVEYLTLLAKSLSVSRETVAELLRRELRLAAGRRGTGFVGGEDAGVLDYGSLKPQFLSEFRDRIGQMLSEARLPAHRKLVDFQTPPRDPAGLAPAYVSVGEFPESSNPQGAVADVQPPGRRLVIRGRDRVFDALIDPDRPDTPLGSQPRDNAIRKADQTSAFLVRFDLDRLELPASQQVRKATATLFVWDPSSLGNTKVVAAPLLAGWDEATVTWRQARAGHPWPGMSGFDPGVHLGSPGEPTVVRPDDGSDLADPPIAYHFDVTEAVRGWRAADLQNHGMAFVPEPDRSVDDGLFTRFQVYASEHPNPDYQPMLTIEYEP